MQQHEAATRTPNFFIVGAPKSGTTAMDTYLAQHPSVFMAEKELHHFADDLLPEDDPCRDLRFYARYFAAARDEKIIGDSSVFYLYSTVAAERIHAYDPQAKILIHVRNPIDFIASHHAQLIYEGGEFITDLEEAVAAEADRRQGRRMPEDFRWKKTLFYTDIARFSDQVERFLKVFGPQRVKVNVFDDFRKDTAAVYRETLQFLDIDPTFQPDFAVVNANKKMRSERLMDLTVRNPPPWLSLPARLLLSEPMRQSVKRRFKQMNTQYIAREPMPGALRNRLQVLLKPDVDRLSDLLERDLTHWYRDATAADDAPEDSLINA